MREEIQFFRIYLKIAEFYSTIVILKIWCPGIIESDL